MLFDLVDTFQQKRRLIFVVAFIGIDLLLVTLCSQTLQANRSGITNRIQDSETSLAKAVYRQDSLGGASMLENIDRTTSSIEISILRRTVAAADGISKAEHGVQAAIKTALWAVRTAAVTTVRAGVRAIGTIAHAIGTGVVFIGRVVVFPFVAVGHGVSYVLGTVSGSVNNGFASVIQPRKDAKIPIITPEQAQQVSLIQKDTLAVTPIKPTGSGGACDNGAGNGGYPMDWCDARMDTIRTVAYGSDRINRQCTSYAFWYFTTIEGHSDFHVTGNANRWARTSNYPTHATPAVGAIAVQTAGAYGHVAIVQALPGQAYEGRVVPDGYILVSEMNYDWQGHFRYSYSPLAKFSAYIYP